MIIIDIFEKPRIVSVGVSILIEIVMSFRISILVQLLTIMSGILKPIVNSCIGKQIWTGYFLTPFKKLMTRSIVSKFSLSIDVLLID